MSDYRQDERAQSEMASAAWRRSSIPDSNDKLSPGWLQEQMDATRRQVESWPDEFIQLRAINTPTGTWGEVKPGLQVPTGAKGEWWSEPRNMLSTHEPNPVVFSPMATQAIREAVSRFQTAFEQHVAFCARQAGREIAIAEDVDVASRRTLTTTYSDDSYENRLSEASVDGNEAVDAAFLESVGFRRKPPFAETEVVMLELPGSVMWWHSTYGLVYGNEALHNVKTRQQFRTFCKSVGISIREEA